MATSSRKTTPISTPLLPTRQSTRKIVKKTLGPDYIQDFPARGSLLILPPDGVLPARRTTPVRGELTKRPYTTAKRQKLPDGQDICVECLKRKPGGQEDGLFLRCTSRGCGFAAHADCLKLSNETVALVKDRYKCEECKRCIICGKGVIATDLNLIHCAHCDTIYHMRCHNPVVDVNSPELKGKYLCYSSWTCISCKIRAEKLKKQTQRDEDALAEALKDTNERLNVVENGSSSQDALDSLIETEDLPNASDGSPVRVFVAHEEMVSDAIFGQIAYENLPNGKTQFEEKEKFDLGKQDLGMDSPHGHDYIVTAMAPIEEPEKFLAEIENTQEEKDEADRRLRQDLSLLSTEQCARHFDKVYPGLGELIRKHGLYGSSLVLISRPQFIDLFGLTLGNALKMHHAVCKWRKSFF